MKLSELHLVSASQCGFPNECGLINQCSEIIITYEKNDCNNIPLLEVTYHSG